MKLLRNTAAVVLAVLLALTFTACHPKNEVAVTVGDYEFTSGYYMCVMVFTDMEARGKVDEQLTEDGEDTTNVDYLKQKIDDKDYSEWVKDTTMENIELIAAYKAACKQAELELDEETVANAEYMADYYWTSYGYSTLFEPNGVSEATFKQYMKDSYYSDLYFEHVYGSEGEKAIADTDVLNTISSKFALANMLEASFADLTEEDITAAKDTFVAYETALNDGSRTFDEIYHEYNETEHEEATEDESTEETEEVLEPLDSHASLIGNEDTNYASDYFEDVAALKAGEVKLITLEDDAGLLLVVKQDVTADPYYVENLDMEARYIIAGEDFEAEMKEMGDELEDEVNDYAVDRFKVKNIEYPETTA